MRHHVILPTFPNGKCTVYKCYKSTTLKSESAPVAASFLPVGLGGNTHGTYSPETPSAPVAASAESSGAASVAGVGGADMDNISLRPKKETIKQTTIKILTTQTRLRLVVHLIDQEDEEGIIRYCEIMFF